MSKKDHLLEKKSSEYEEIPDAFNAEDNLHTLTPMAPRPALIPRVTGRLIEEKSCRICLDDDSPETMIAPCQCSGSSRWVHRECLDAWRVQEKDRAFSQCTECLFQYHFEPVDSNRTRRFWSKAKFCLYCSRDVCLVALAVQAVVVILSSLVYLIDRQLGQPLLDFMGSDCENGNSFWCHAALAVYYFGGAFVLLILLGLFGSTLLCVHGCQFPDIYAVDHDGPQDTLPAEQRQERNHYYRQQRHRRHRRRHFRNTGCCDCCNDVCGTRYYYGPRFYYFGGGGDDDCDCTGCSRCCDGVSACGSGHRGGDGDNNGLHILLVILLAVAIIMAIIGFVVGIVMAIYVAQRIIQRHVFLLHKKQLAQEFQVRDLQDYDVASSQNDLEAPSPAVLATPLPPPSMDPNDEQQLRKLGLM